MASLAACIPSPEDLETDPVKVQTPRVSSHASFTARIASPGIVPSTFPATKMSVPEADGYCRQEGLRRLKSLTDMRRRNSFQRGTAASSDCGTSPPRMPRTIRRPVVPFSSLITASLMADGKGIFLPRTRRDEDRPTRLPEYRRAEEYSRSGGCCSSTCVGFRACAAACSGLIRTGLKNLKRRFAIDTACRILPPSERHRDHRLTLRFGDGPQLRPRRADQSPLNHARNTLFLQHRGDRLAHANLSEWRLRCRRRVFAIGFGRQVAGSCDPGR